MPLSSHMQKADFLMTQLRCAYFRLIGVYFLSLFGENSLPVPQKEEIWILIRKPGISVTLNEYPQLI